MWRWKRTGESRYAATSLTFGLLVVAYAFRVLAPQASIHDVAIHRIVRGPALLSAVVSIGLLIRHHVRRASRGKRRSPAVAAFDFQAADRLLELRHELLSRAYCPGPYTHFFIHEP